MFNKQQLINIYSRFLDKQKLTTLHVVLSAGGACVMHGLRKHTNDLDLFVSQSTFDILKKRNNFKVRMFDVNDIPTESLEYIDYKAISIYVSPIYPSFHVLIQGVNCYSLSMLLKQKKMLNRQKDQEDIIKISEAIKLKG